MGTEKLNRAPGKLRGIAALGESQALLFLLRSPKIFCRWPVQIEKSRRYKDRKSRARSAASEKERTK
jgi:hypothetical protein